jgi:hypothetical protein
VHTAHRFIAYVLGLPVQSVNARLQALTQSLDVGQQQLLVLFPVAMNATSGCRRLGGRHARAHDLVGRVVVKRLEVVCGGEDGVEVAKELRERSQLHVGVPAEAERRL